MYREHACLSVNKYMKAQKQACFHVFPPFSTFSTHPPPNDVTVNGLLHINFPLRDMPWGEICPEAVTHLGWQSTQPSSVHNHVTGATWHGRQRLQYTHPTALQRWAVENRSYCRMLFILATSCQELMSTAKECPTVHHSTQRHSLTLYQPMMHQCVMTFVNSP